MACTNQSAVDFIKKAWIHLVKNLKHQELIAENLEELGVFNFDDVTAVTSEKNPLTQTRNLLDSVTKKGEEASYVFLRILDGKKNMTLPKNVRPDLHYWISCFPFREESDLQPNGPRSCQLYQAQLKTKALKILHTHTEQINFVFGRNAVQCFSYTPLVLDRAGQGYAEPTKIKQKTKKYKKSRPKKLSAYIPKSKPQLSPDYLLECNEQSILLVGKPGIGKTTVALEMINLWVKKENCKLNYLFYFDETTLCGMSSPVDLESLLFGAYAEPSLNRDEVLEDIKKNSEHVTIIVDNINSVQRNSVLRKIFDKDLLPEAKVVVTCRLDYEEFLSIETCLRVCVEGFSEESIQTYMSHMLRDKPDALSYILGNPEMFSLCYVPVNALMVAACMLFPMTVTSNLFTTTEVYLNIFRQIMKKCDSDLTLRQLDKFIQCNMEKIQDLSKDAFLAINQRSIVLEGCDDTNIEHNFLHLLTMRDGPTSVKTYSAFLHNTLQEFFAAIWLLSNPGDIDGFFHQCKTDEGKHMRHVIPFLCGLLSERNLSLVSCICPEERIKVTSTGFIEKLLSLYINADQDFEDSNEELLFLCQCLFELQSLQACSVFLSRVNYNLDLADGHLHPHQCCTLSYVIKQARMKVVLDLENCRISKQGLNFILDCNEYVRIDSSLLRQIWTATLSWENPGVFPDLLKLSGPEMHLPAWDLSVFERAGEMIRQHPQQMSLVLHCHQSAQSLSEDLCSAIVSVLPHITSLRFTEEELNEYPKGVFRFLLDLSVAAAVSDSATGQSFSELLCSVCTFPFEEIDRCADYYNGSHNEFLLDLCSKVKDIEILKGRSLLPALRPFYQSAPAVWSIDLSKRKASLLLEVLKLQTQKKPVELRGWSDEESEVRSFLQCLPYISQLSCTPPQSEGMSLEEWERSVKSFHLHLCLQTALYEWTSVRTLMTLFSVSNEFDFLLDLYYYVRDYESQMGSSLIPALRPVYKFTLAVWSIDLSKRKASLLLEVLKLHTQKKPVELRGWSDEESEVRSFLQCLPYISQLSCTPPQSEGMSLEEWERSVKSFHLHLCLQTALYEWTSVRTLMTLFSVSNESDFLLDLYYYVRDYESQIGRSLIPALRPIYHFTLAVWSIDLSKRKASLLLEVLKLQTQKKPVELRGWSDEESDVSSFLQCLPYISQLRFTEEELNEYPKGVFRFLLDLSVAAAVSDSATGQSFSELLCSVCTFPFEEIDRCADYYNGSHNEFLLDLCSKVKDIEILKGRSLLPALRPFYQSAPAVWSIDLSKRKASLLLEVLKLQTQKKPVELRGWSDEESEVRSFLQCLPYISQLSCTPPQSEGMSLEEWERSVKSFHLHLCLQTALYEWTSVRTLMTLFSVSNESDFLLDLYYYVRDYESQIGRSLIPALRPVYKFTLAVWSIDLSKRKASLLLEVLKLQTQKKPVELRGWSDEESEVRSFLQCLPYISQLRLNITMVMRLARAMRTGRGLAPVSVEELSLYLNSKEVSQRVLSRVLSCLALLLRLWTVQCLDLTSCRVEGHSLIILLCQQDPLKLRLSKENTQQLFMLVSDAQNVEIIESFLNKVGGDLTSCTLTQEVLLHLLQHHSGPVTVDFRKSKITERNVRDFLHLLDRIRFKRLSPGFIMFIIMEIYQSRSAQYVSSLLRSTENHINLTTRGLDAADCAALRFTLQHSQGVRLNLMWTSIPEGELESLLKLLTNVSQLSVDRQLLLRILHCCYSSDAQQGAAAALLQALQHRLDFSCSSAMDLTEETQEPPLHLTPEDCMVVSMVIQRVSVNPELMLMDCDVEEVGLEHLFSVLERIRLRCSKGQLLQLLTLVCVGSERECVRRAVSLSHAVGGEVDLSHTVLDARACGSLALFLEYSEGLSELDLSHCQLTDHCLEPLLSHLHKSQTLDLSNNSITDEGAQLIHNTVNAATSIQTVRLFNNKIRSRQLFQGDARFELW
ncbi:uncharacterized protein LOC121689616 isoform X3 [Alosa sapidissima]|uniref:uncharacterized protein LOC121689616 isoform X3 n=1 Tax=Alosa sapidissima TaxID=34773 RepID=UPI001C0A2DCF|nr:uncharacterized protein LOC121689616 isoform X3 [Alosa sapidissima]